MLNNVAVTGAELHARLAYVAHNGDGVVPLVTTVVLVANQPLDRARARQPPPPRPPPPLPKPRPPPPPLVRAKSLLTVNVAQTEAELYVRRVNAVLSMVGVVPRVHTVAPVASQPSAFVQARQLPLPPPPPPPPPLRLPPLPPLRQHPQLCSAHVQSLAHSLLPLTMVRQRSQILCWTLLSQRG